nr:12586_t:CDS:2 [Entrophospora candida]
MEEGNFLTQCWNSKGMHSLPFFCFYEEKDANGERIEEELGYYARNNHLSGLATCRAGNGNQAQGEDVKQFWKDVELKKIESENKLLGVKIKQAELQFSVDRTLVGNEAYIILDQKKLDYALNSNSALKNIRKHLADGEEKTDTGPWQYIGPTQRKAIGKKGDAFVRTFGSTSTGWVASEAGQKWEGAHGTKFMEETSLSL